MALFPLLAGGGLAFLLIHFLEAEIQPLMESLAETTVRTAVIAVIDSSVERSLAEESVCYEDLIHIRTDDGGYVTAMTADTVKLNWLRTDILSRVMEQVDSIDSRELQIPFGNLTGFSWLSGRGPGLPVQVVSAAAPEAEFHNVFTSAGINQTLHRVMLEVSVKINLFLPGGVVETVVNTQVCVAETVIVGQVPGTYLELPESRP